MKYVGEAAVMLKSSCESLQKAAGAPGALCAPRTSPARSEKHFVSGSEFLYWDWNEQKLLLHHFPCLVHPGALLAQDALQDSMLFCWELQVILQGGGKGQLQHLFL